MNLLKSHFIALFLLLCFLPSSVYAFDACCMKLDEEVLEWRSIVGQQKFKECSTSNKKETDAVVAVIKAFWLANKDHVSFFAQRYRKHTESNYNSFKDEHKYIFDPERMWIKHEFKTINYSEKIYMDVLVLSTWVKSGYSGTTTFTFYMLYEDNEWKITFLAY